MIKKIRVLATTLTLLAFGSQLAAQTCNTCPNANQPSKPTSSEACPKAKPKDDKKDSPKKSCPAPTNAAPCAPQPAPCAPKCGESTGVALATVAIGLGVVTVFAFVAGMFTDDPRNVHSSVAE
jgi:hypothetical protein